MADRGDEFSFFRDVDTTNVKYHQISTRSIRDVDQFQTLTYLSFSKGYVHQI